MEDLCRVSPARGEDARPRKAPKPGGVVCLRASIRFRPPTVFGPWGVPMYY